MTIDMMAAGTIPQALTDAAYQALDPIAVIEARRRGPAIVWINRSFAQAVRGELEDLADRPIDKVLETAPGEFELSEVRPTTPTMVLQACDGSRSQWSTTTVPTRLDGRTTWVVQLTKPGSAATLDEQLAASEERFRALSERAPIGIFSSDLGLRFGYANDAFADMLGVSASQLLGTNWMEFILPDDLETVIGGLQEVLVGGSFEGPARLRHSNGREIWVNLRVVPVLGLDSGASFLGTVEDVTERRDLEAFLSWQATHDPLTELPSRSELVGQVQAELDAGAEGLALLFFDLDDFKAVNDMYGHTAGDQLLIHVADQLRSSVRSHDRVYRFAGDEFVVLAHEVGSEDEALGFANRILREVSQAADIGGRSITVSCSVGIARAVGITSAEDLIHDADTAMYQAKHAGKGKAQLIDARVGGIEGGGPLLRERVLNALAEGAISLSYQPVVELGTGRTVAVEAALYWDDPEEGPVSSTLIAEAAIQGGLIADVTELLIDQSCADLAAWRADGVDIEWVVVHMVPEQVLVTGLVDHLARQLLASRLSGPDFRIKIFESAWATASPSAHDVMRDLLSLGPRLVLDGVGGGLTSLSVFTSGLVAALKLDHGFLFEGGDRHRRVVQATVNLARDLDVEVLASGVQTPAEAAHAEELGIELGMGLELGPPMIAAAVSAMLERDHG